MFSDNKYNNIEEYLYFEKKSQILEILKEFLKISPKSNSFHSFELLIENQNLLFKINKNSSNCYLIINDLYRNHFDLFINKEEKEFILNKFLYQNHCYEYSVDNKDNNNNGFSIKNLNNVIFDKKNPETIEAIKKLMKIDKESAKRFILDELFKPTINKNNYDFENDLQPVYKHNYEFFKLFFKDIEDLKTNRKFSLTDLEILLKISFSEEDTMLELFHIIKKENQTQHIREIFSLLGNSKHSVKFFDFIFDIIKEDTDILSDIYEKSLMFKNTLLKESFLTKINNCSIQTKNFLFEYIINIDKKYDLEYKSSLLLETPKEKKITNEEKKEAIVILEDIMDTLFPIKNNAKKNIKIQKSKKIVQKI